MGVQSFPRRRRIVTLLSATGLALLGTCPLLELRATVSADLRSVRGEVSCTEGALPASAAVYPRALRHRPALDDINRAWHYPQGFEPAELELHACGDLECGASRALTSDGPWQALPADIAALRFATAVPRRVGLFGRDRGTLYLLAPWHPVPAAPGPLPRQRYRYDVTVPADVVGLIGDRPVRRQAQPQRLRGEFIGRSVPLLLAAGLRVDRSGPAIILTPEEAPAEDSTGHPHHLRDLTEELDPWAREHLAETLSLGWAAARRSGIPLRPMVIVRGPNQERLIEPFDGGFMIGRRGMHVFPLERFMKFHRVPLWRAQLRALLVPHLAQWEADPGGLGLDPEAIADAVASALRDRLALERYAEKETAVDLLDTLAVIPEIDALVFAPQTPFMDAYYEAIDETPALRTRPDEVLSTRPAGKLLYEKLLDALGPAQTQRLFDGYLKSRRPWLEVLAENEAGLDPAAILSPWLGEYPRLDYRLGEVRHEGGEIVVEVAADGPDAARVREPVTVSIEDEDGELHRATRIGPGELRVPAAAAPDDVQIDPDGRLVEHHHVEGEAPRLNNRDYERWRFLLNNITGLFAITNGEISAAIDFSLRRIHDLRWAFRFFGTYQPETFGGGYTASYAFGHEVTPLKLAHQIGTGAAYERLTPVRGVAPQGDQVSFSLFYHYDDRLSPYWSYEGQGVHVSAVGALAWDVDGKNYQFVQLAASAFKLFPIADGHSLLGRVRGDLEIGAAPAQNGYDLGGRYRAGRGFERDEGKATRRIVVSSEYRHVFAADGRTDFFGLLTATRIEGAAFADLVHMPIERPGCSQQMFYDVGYGLRFMGEIFNILPATLQIDVGVPLNRCADQSHRLPITVYVALLQSFVSF